MAKIGRNELCPCGSGKKYKKCCISAGAPPVVKPFPPELEAVVQQKQREMQAERVQREKQQGLGKGIISTEVNGGRVVCVGNTVLHSKSWKTFHDFLRDYLIDRLGRRWFSEERAKPDQGSYPFLRSALGRVRPAANLGVI